MTLRFVSRCATRRRARVYAVEGPQVKRARCCSSMIMEVQARTCAGLPISRPRKKRLLQGGRLSQAAKATADVQKAQASRDQLHRDNETLTKLVAEKAATSVELEQNKLQLTQAEADVQATQKVKQTLDRQAQLDEGRVALQVEHARATVQDLEERLESAHGTAPDGPFVGAIS